GDCNYGSHPDTSASIAADLAYEAQVGEGIDAVARNEFLCVSSTTFDTASPGFSTVLLGTHSSFVDAIGLRPPDLRKMAASGTALVWSPRSNLALYGDTAVVAEASRMGI